MKKIKILAAAMLAAGLIAIAAGGAFLLSGNASKRPEKTFSDYMREADVYFADNDYYKALASYESALSEEAENHEALLGLADTYNRQGDYQNEAVIRRQIADLYPEDLDNQIGLINVLVHMKEFDEAKSRTEELVKTNDSPQLQFLYKEMNVEAPVFNLTGGSYDEYQLLELTSTYDTATVRYTTDGSAPSEESPALTQDGIVISYPQTQIRAVAISSLGFSSEETVLDFEITKEVEGVSYMDDSNAYYALSSLLRDMEINPENFDTINNYEAAQIRRAYLNGRYSASATASSELFYDGGFERNNSRYDEKGSDDLAFVAYTPFLETLVFACQKDVDLSPLEDLQYLKELSLLNDDLTDISSLSGLHSLERLALGWNSVEDVSPLAELTSLKSLGLWNNDISDISALKGLEQLEYLDISHNNVEDISVAAGMPNLTEVWINDNRISSLAPLSGCEKLFELMTAGNPITDYGNLKERTEQMYNTDLEQ